MKPPPDQNDTSGPTKNPKSAAERKRYERRLKVEQKQNLRVVFTKRYLDDLVSDGDGRITAKDLEDPEKLGAEIEEDYFCQKRGVFQPGPICATVAGIDVTCLASEGCRG